MRTRQFHVFWVLVFLMAVWASELSAPPTPGATRETVIPLPLSTVANDVVTAPATTDLSGTPVNMNTCFEREPEAMAAANDYAPDGDFATGIENTPLILAVYKRRREELWDYAERCNTAEFYKQAKVVKKLRTASLASDLPWHTGSFAGGSGHPSGYGPPRATPNVLDFGQGGGGGGFGGSGGGGGFGGGEGPHGPGLVGDSSQGGLPGDKDPPGGNPDDRGPGGDGPGNSDPGPGSGDPGSGGPGNHEPGNGDPTVLPEPGTLALFLGLAVGFGLMRRRVSSI